MKIETGATRLRTEETVMQRITIMLHERDYKLLRFVTGPYEPWDECYLVTTAERILEHALAGLCYPGRTIEAKQEFVRRLVQNNASRAEEENCEAAEIRNAID
jgi:hypothetical protein